MSDPKTSKELQDGKIIYRKKRRYRKYELKKIRFTLSEASAKLGVSSWIFKSKSKLLFTRKHTEGKRPKYSEKEIEAIRQDLSAAKKSKTSTNNIIQFNPDHLFDGFDGLVDLQG